MEICGGAGGSTRLAVRYRLTSDRNFDLTTGFDLLIPQNQLELLAYLSQAKPLVIICAPPCTAFGGWATYNAWRSPDQHKMQLRRGKALANLVAACCSLQLREGRHYCREPANKQIVFLASIHSIG